MRVMVFFDLPVQSPDERRIYSRFHKYLLGEGFVKIQYSVYSKVTLNSSASDAVIQNIRKNKPPDGIVQVLVITEKQFQGIEYMVGESQKEVVDSQERFVVL